jgi:hypothetical protein
MTKFPAIAVKVTISAALLIYLLRIADISAVREAFGQASVLPLLGAVVVMLTGLVVSAWKWQILLRVDGIHCSLATLCRYYLVGIYFNNFLPTSIGGDAARVYFISKEYGKSIGALTSIFAERFSGLLALILYAIFASSLEPRVAELGMRSSIVGLMGMALGVSLLFFCRSFQRGFWSYLPKRLRSKAEQFAMGLRRYLADRTARRTMVWTSLVYPFLVILVYFMCARSLGGTITITALAVVVPLVTLLTLIPFSLNGLGIREGGFVFLLSFFGVAKAEALSISLLCYALTLLFSVVGGLIFLGMRRNGGIAS